MYWRVNNLALVLAVNAVGACGVGNGAPGSDESATTDEESLADGVKADTAPQAARSNLFVQRGLVQDLAAALGPQFQADYRLRVPGALEAFVSYGGDMLSTVQAAGVELERIWSTTPGGAVLGVLQSSGWANGNPRGAHRSAQALFNAMTRARETRTVDGTITNVERASAGGRVKCVQSIYQRSASYRCTFKDLLFLRPL
ncbi:MAG: hypothetical protein HYY84_08390 [Deltaproteobacteria bacterium]|nr:hypothetical protein [Deltaproteobacteria bacterium]